MDAKEFVEGWRKEKDLLKNIFCDVNSGSQVSLEIDSLDLNLKQKKLMKKIIDDLLTDTFYGLLLGLDGAGSIGGKQQQYTLLDDNDSKISNNGDIESEAYSQFHK